MKPILISCILAALMTLNAGPVVANDFDKSIAQAREGVEKSSFAQALEAARRARALNPGDFRSYYYEAMAQLGVGNKAEARAAVKAAQERAPASAKDALQKLAQMAAEPAATSNDAAQTSRAVLISCTYSGQKKSYHRRRVDPLLEMSFTQEQVEEVSEKTTVYRLEDQSLEYWHSSSNSWTRLFSCSTNTKTETEKRSDRIETTTTLPLEYRATADRFYAKCVRRFEFDSPSTLTSDISGMSQSISINRLTGAYSGERETHWSDKGRPWREEHSGTCRPAKDPSAAPPKF